MPAEVHPPTFPLAAFTVNVAHGRTRLLGRDDSNPIRVGEEMGQDAAGANADLVIVDIRQVSSWRISDVVGYEHVVSDGKAHWPTTAQMVSH